MSINARFVGVLSEHGLRVPSSPTSSALAFGNFNGSIACCKASKRRMDELPCNVSDRRESGESLGCGGVDSDCGSL